MSDMTWTHHTNHTAPMPDRPGRPTPEQTERLLRPIRPERVYEQQGQSYVAGWEIAAHLTRMFGFCGWEKAILALEPILEHSKQRTNNQGIPQCDDAGEPVLGWYVTWRCSLRLTIYDAHGQVMWVNEDAATGSASNQTSPADAHDLAMKTAITTALKRCAKDLGDQFGLSLYNKGSQREVVQMTLVGGAEDEPEPDVTVEGEDLEGDR